ncbi:MAG: ferric reductase-like transmembrane domain-containing protein [Patescibacteria group bacterium]
MQPKKNYLTYENFLYSGSVLLGVLYVYLARDAQNGFLASRVFGNLAVFFLYISLLASALNAHFKSFPGRMFLIKYRKAHGLTAFFLAATHGYFGLFSVVGGVSELLKSDAQFLFPIIAGMLAFDILLILAITSLRVLVRKLGIWWKRVHRFVYLSSLLILAHVVLVRIYYYSLGDLISIVELVLFAILIVLQLLRYYKYLNRKKPKITSPKIPQPNTVQTQMTQPNPQ